MKIKRMWINQPSTLQPLHGHDGLNVIAVLDNPAEGNPKMARVYPVKGKTISMRVPVLCLSDGWTERA